ncbi:MAG TPA: carboxylating nicotinate-nucleotide diphosphorylase [Terriglobales bacterium]|nr:carboxylating nicotinate-nucleotide diphosphorylase [Terriglobales bacterium]
MPGQDYDAIIQAALREDMPLGDVTSESIVPAGAVSEAVILAKEDGVLAGLPVARRVFELVDPRVEFAAASADGRAVKKGDVLARLKGPTVSLLKAERTALNFLQLLSGVATATRRFVDAAAGTKARILDTRKTTPGLRLLEKHAVRMGGGTNHRLGLSDMVLIKDNHLRFVGTIAEAVRRARAAAPAGMKIEVEVTSLDELRQALAAGADIVMLDNMSLEETREAVAIAAGRVPLEVSGRVTLERVRDIAAAGVDLISVGALTHSPRALDISLEFLS